ncbi:hypothetical protein IGI04_043110 [Brassica rapa subsp. trilocularis]|uniref:Uncharacterized protein n=1 Tax=Brassica rapa subsp. trilocularis TaxID=1813537 RepID=A0ABQ7KI89_BRACM|nr:hypothetical protein IGI04_043110 [Brassica rapa subsp. trilocularis]
MAVGPSSLLVLVNGNPHMFYNILKGNIKNMSTKSLGCQVLIKSCCRHPFRPRNADLCSMQKTWLEAKEIYENLPENSFNHPYEGMQKIRIQIRNSPEHNQMLLLWLDLFGVRNTARSLRLRVDGRLSPVNFPGETFAGEFSVDRLSPNFNFRACMAWPCVQSIFPVAFFDYIQEWLERLMFSGS